MKDLSAIESWDETYVHTSHNPNRVVQPNSATEITETLSPGSVNPGKGRVFYLSVGGHDERTWSNPGFQALVEHGIRWASENSYSARPPG